MGTHFGQVNGCLCIVAIVNKVLIAKPSPPRLMGGALRRKTSKCVMTDDQRNTADFAVFFSAIGAAVILVAVVWI